MKRTLVFLSNVIALAGLLAALAAGLWGVWQVLPESTRVALRDPRSVVDGARRGAQNGPTNPLVALGRWLSERAAAARDAVDTVRAADGTSDGIVPLPAWTSVDTQRLFGATETLWQSRRAKLTGARWSRVVFSWADVQPRGPRDWRAGYYLSDSIIRRERDNGVELVGLLMNTPAWAAAQPQAGAHAVPAGLYRPVADPQNFWAAYVRKMASDYRGRIDTWIIWNEPDIHAGDPNAQYLSWAGDERDYARLLKVAYLAAKAANPKARILFASTTYWADANANRPLYLERTLAQLATDDPEAKAYGYYFDAVGLNLYTSPDDVRRVAGLYRQVLDRYGLSAPLWLTETNAVPYDDPTKGFARPQNGLRVTMDQQASFVIQAYALGISAGYERIAFHAATDRDTQDELWGLIRNDGSLRPAFVAYQTAARYMGGATRAVFAGKERAAWRWPPGGYVPNWQTYLVVLERDAGAPEPPAASQPTPGGAPGARPATTAKSRQRVSVIWNGDPDPVEVALPRVSEQAALLDKYGRPLPLEADGDRWRLTLPGAAAHSPLDPEGYFFIGGDPLLLVEDGVPDGAPVAPPA